MGKTIYLQQTERGRRLLLHRDDKTELVKEGTPRFAALLKEWGRTG